VRIALVCPYDWAAPGGVQVHVRELADAFRSSGHDVEVLAPSRLPRIEGGDRVGTPVSVPYNGSTAPIDPRPWHVGRVRQALRSLDPDVVHVHEPFVPSTSLWATLASDAPVVATFHSGAASSVLYDVAAPVLRRVAARIDARVAVSTRAAAVARARIGGSFEIVPNGIDVDSFARVAPADIGPGRKLLFVGRLDRRKGFPVALEAFRLLAARYDDVRLIVVGSGTERPAIERMAPDVRARISMLGAVPNGQLPPIHQACDVFLGPSLGGESFGVILIEAMAAGMPIATSRIPGYDEVVDDGVTGLLVPPGDPEALATAVGRILDDTDLARRLAAAAAERARRYDWSVVAREIEAVYRRAVGGSDGVGAGPPVP
jgi:phosphatidylinositol alpha-mannosyltransferase